MQHLKVALAKEGSSPVSDPQPGTANDVVTLRAIAQYYANYPEIATNLYVAADYLAVLYHGQQQEPAPSPAPSEEIEAQPVEVPLTEVTSCPMRWEVEVKSVAAGNDIREEICGRVATEPVEYQGIVYVVCPDCREELIGMGGKKVGASAER